LKGPAAAKCINTATRIACPAGVNPKTFSKSGAGKYKETVWLLFYLIYALMWKINP
jgi:hypothetical protein